MNQTTTTPPHTKAQAFRDIHNTAGLLPGRIEHREEHGVPGKLIAADIIGLSGPLEVGRVGLVFHQDTRALASALALRYNTQPDLLEACQAMLGYIEIKQAREAMEDCQDFLSAIVDATEGNGQIDRDSIMRYGERLKTTARKLNQKALAALEGLK